VKPPDLAEIHRQFPAVAEYLSGIYILRRDYGHAGNTKLSDWVGVSGSAVTQALGRLKRLGLARQKRYGDIALTAKGQILAVEVLRRHYLLEHLLVGVLGYPWEQADLEAKLLQSLISEDLTDHLFRRLGYPQACPHGNPMPGSRIEPKLLAAPRLCDAPDGRSVRILRITEEGEQVSGLLAACGARGIQPGARLRVIRRDRRNLYLARRGSTARLALPLAMAEHIRFGNDRRSSTGKS